MLLDTNIIIAYLCDDEEAIRNLRRWFTEGRPLFVSVVTYAEVLSLKEASFSDLTRIREFLKLFAIISIDINLAENIALIRRHEQIKFPDATIVATALYLNTTLVTRDKRLHKIKGLKAITI